MNNEGQWLNSFCGLCELTPIIIGAALCVKLAFGFFS
jgi:hypothetical protein